MTKALYFIRCSFRPKKDSEPIYGFAICSDADTPVTFIHPDGTPLRSKVVWDYMLHHYSPWGRYVVWNLRPKVKR